MPKMKRLLLAAAHPKAIDEIDGLKLMLQDGWILIRQSGTEPKMRITVEAKTQKRAQAIFNKSIELIEGLAGASNKS